MVNKRENKDQKQTITIYIDQTTYTIPAGYTLATAITFATSLGYSKTQSGHSRGPVCNMGVCFECSVYVEGRGNIRACMTEVENGMVVHTEPDFEQITPVEQQTVTENKEGSNKKIPSYDVVIIGAGPAGLGAAEELAHSNLKIAIIDEQKNAGGQIYRHIPENIHPSKPNELVERITKLEQLHWIQGSAVWSIVPYSEDGYVSTSTNKKDVYHIYLENKPFVRAKKIIMATGAYDYITPFKGWTKPGVMSAGGLQLFAKTQHFVPGNDVLLVGSHPFLLIVAKQIMDAGGSVKGIAFSQSFPKLKELFSYGVSGLRKWSKSKELLHTFRAILKEKIPIWFNTIPMEAVGENQVNRVEIGKVNPDGTVSDHDKLIVDCDLVGACYGFIASSELPRQLGCAMSYNEVMGGHIVEVDERMHSNIDNIYVAGELVGVGGAELSEVEGRLAGLAILQDFQQNITNKQQKKLAQLTKSRKSWLSFATMLGEATKVDFDLYKLLESKPDTHVCRCEEITFAQITDVLQTHPHLTSLDAIKLMTRVGMGLCQGRYCERTLYKMAETMIGAPFNEEQFTDRFPVKSITINDLFNK